MATRLKSTDLGRRRYRLTAAQIEAMIAAGIFPEGDDLELLGGVLFKMVKKEPHNFAVAQVANALRRLLPAGFHVREEKSLRLSKRSLPEPDVVVAIGPAGTYRPRPPKRGTWLCLLRSAITRNRPTTKTSIADTRPRECQSTGSSTCIAAESKSSQALPVKDPRRDTRNRPGTPKIVQSHCVCSARLLEPSM